MCRLEAMLMREREREQGARVREGCGLNTGAGWSGRVRCVVNAYGEFVVLFWGFGERVRVWRTRQGTHQVCTVAWI